MSIRGGVKIKSKDNTRPIKALWNEWRDSYRGNEKYLPPPPPLVSLIYNFMSGTHILTNKRNAYFVHSLV